MPNIIMYGTAISPPCRAVWLTAEALGIKLENIEVNLVTREQMKPEFLKMNPQHTLPTINDSGFCIWDSHAIMCYLANNYGKNSALYPTEPMARARIDQRLHFDTGSLFSILRTICKPIFMKMSNTIPNSAIQELKNTLDILNTFLKGSHWLAGDSYTLADISCVTTVSSLTALISMEKYENIKAWIERCEQRLPGYAKWNKPGNDIFFETIHSLLEDGEQYPLK